MQCYPFIHTEDPDCAEAADQLQLVCAHDCPAQPVQWLWPEKIPLGKVTLLIGDPGTGKSLVAIDIAARASRGGPWPVAKGEGGGGKGEGNPKNIPSASNPLPSPLPLPPSSTILLSASDDLADTIRPRLDAAGADPHRVFVIPSIADLRDDFKQLRAAVNRAPNCRLIVIDPINAYVGPGDSHFQTVVRKVLAPLAQLAAERHIAVIAIAHLRKNEGDAIYRAAGSIGYVAAARSVWSVSRDPQNTGRHLLLPVKNNLGPDPCGLAYTIQPTGPLAAPALAWDPAPIGRDEVPVKLRRREAADLHPVRLWLRDERANGPRAAGELLEAAAQLGFHERTVRRALHALGGHTQHRGILDGWWWSLPESEAEGEGVKAEGDNLENAPPPSALPPSTFPPPPSQDTVPLCPLPKISTNPPPDSPASPQNVPPPNPQSEIRNPQSAPSPNSSFDIRHSSFPHNPQSEIRNPPSPSISQSIAAINRLDRGRRHDHRPNAKPRAPRKTGHPVLDAILHEFRTINGRSNSENTRTRQLGTNDASADNELATTKLTVSEQHATSVLLPAPCSAPEPMSIAENLQRVRDRIARAAESAGRGADEITLVGVTKYVGPAEAAELASAGCTDLGESRPQELWRKVESLTGEPASAGGEFPPIRWHLVGHLQRNKARRTLPLVSLIHSVDSERLVAAIDEARAAAGDNLPPVRVLLEVNTSGELAKHGIAPDAVEPLLGASPGYPHVAIEGLMTMAALEGGPEVATRNFATLRDLRDRLKSKAPPGVRLDELSMGMSGDFEVAIREGATIVRIGTLLWDV